MSAKRNFNKAIAEQKQEKLSNLKRMLSKRLITKEEFEERIK